MTVEDVMAAWWREFLARYAIPNTYRGDLLPRDTEDLSGKLD